MDGQIVEQTLVEVLRRYRPLVAAYLFGSAAEGLAHRHSDLDVALLLAEGLDADARLDLRMEIVEALEHRTGRRVDVVILNDAPPVLRFQALRHGRLLLVRDDDIRCLFEMRSYNLYYDFKPYHDFLVSHLIEHIRKEGLGLGYGGARDTLAEVGQLSQALATAPKGST